MKVKRFRWRQCVADLLAQLGTPVLSRLPLRVLYPLSRIVAMVAYRILNRDRNRALLHLRLAYQDRLSAHRMHLITKGMFNHLARLGAECLSLYTQPSEKIWNRIQIDRPQILRDALAKGRGLVILTAHLGNWEYLAAELFHSGFTGLVLSRKVRSAAFQALVEKWRKKLGILEWHTHSSVKPLLGCLRKNVCIGVLNDQDLEKAEGIFVDFFGIPAFTPRFVSELSYKTGAPMAPCLAVRRKNKTHLIKIYPVIEPREGEDREDYAVRSQKEYASILEKTIRHHPTQWVWFHKRWKTRPKVTVSRCLVPYPTP